MKQEELNKITETVEGYEVKNLRFLKVDNIITGLVKDPLFGRPNLHGGFVSGQWHTTGIPTNSIKGRKELKLNLEIPK